MFNSPVALPFVSSTLYQPNGVEIFKAGLGKGGKQKDRVLAMSFPAERMRAFYRNPLWQVKSVLDMRHQGHYKAGKGRTGLMVCAYLVYSGMAAEEALQLYAYKRTTNNEGVSIPSQRRYVGYWASILSFPRGVHDGPPDVRLPKKCSRQLLRIRLYDTVNINSVFFVVSELQEIPGQLYRPPVEISKSCCRSVKKGFQRSPGPRYYVSFIEGDEGNKLESEEPRVVVQMDTESSILYQKTCLEHCFEKPVQVSGDVRVIFYKKMIGSRLFYACFNTAFIKKGLLQFSLRELDKVGSQGRSICGPAFCLELQFGPANPKGSLDENNDDSI
ncbi:hypothetical protein LWI28_010623 [Acer negundo]|uniref:Uncharacterized protein n=1 Tax=Acer negundo TaxID=4023 RepID=A0AAD5I5R0_ACENE|nr:hypothetical protein LWI28_010623 [Acer negundo]